MPPTQPMPVAYPRFRIISLLWLMTLLASGMSAFGPGWGMLLAGLVCVLHLLPRQELSVVELLVAAAIVLLLIALLTPAISTPKPVARRYQSMNMLKQLALAMHNHHDANQRFPPAWSMDDAGAPRHSWRTLLLPFLELNPLFSKIKLDEPWDSPANSKLLDGLELAYLRSPREPARDALPDETHYFAVVDDEAVWRPGKGLSFRDFKDGTAKTIVMIEAAGRGVRWHEPRDLTMDEAIDLLTGEADETVEWVEPGWLVSTRYRGDGLWGRVVAFADGHVELIYRVIDRETARALLTPAGGEEIPEDYHDWEGYREAMRIGHIIHWPRVIATVVFVGLSVGPLLRKPSEENRSEPPSGEA